MTSPKTTTAEVVATMAAATIQDDPPNLNLTADLPTASTDIETHVPMLPDKGALETLLKIEDNGKDDVGEVAEVAGQEVHQESERAEGVASSLTNDGLPRDVEVIAQDQQKGVQEAQKEIVDAENVASAPNHNGLPQDLEMTAQDQHMGNQQVQQDLVRAGDVVSSLNHDGLPRDFVSTAQDQHLRDQLVHQDLICPEDAAIPQLNPDGLQDYDLPDQAHIAGLNALLAMGQMGQLGYPPNLAFAQNGLDMPMLPMPNQDNQWLDQADYVPDVTRPEDRLVGYAKLVFEDGEFYMNTHSVILGRDPTAHRAAQRREKEESKRKMEADTPGPRTPVQIKREHISYNKSVFSEKSGIMRDGNDSDAETREKKRLRRKASKKSKSTGSSHELSRRNSLAVVPPKPHIYEAQFPARIKEENAVPVDPASLRPDPNECPLIPLHPSGNAPASAYKSISREHVKIAYNFNKSTFEMHIYGRNGAFVDEVYHPQNSVVELRSGNMLQIGQVPLEFVLPDGIIDSGQVAFDDEAAENRGRGGKEMSFDFEEEKREGAPEESSPELVSAEEDEDDEEEAEDGEGEREELEADEADEGEESDVDQEMPPLVDAGDYRAEGEEEEMQDGQLESTQSGKKRGPGRPPKNGIMSAREQREIKLALKGTPSVQKAQKSQKALIPVITSPTDKEKKKVGRPRKHDKPNPTEPEKPKRKYTKRKPKELKEGEVREEGSGEDQAAKEKKEKKVKPPRSPSPTFIESECTPEQLQKPTANYVTLIYDALSNSKEGKLGLPQIYRAIQRKYPYFVLKVGTLGWQSSVRHNLSQHHAFEKVEKDGKGWMWGIVKGVSIEKEKKRRTPPPQMGGMHHQPIYQAGQHYMGYPPPQYGPHPGYMQHQYQHGPHPGQPPYGPPPYMNGPPPPSQPPPKPINPGLAAAMIPQLQSSNRSYSSPYAPTPAPAPAPASAPASAPAPTSVPAPTTSSAPPAEPPRIEQLASTESQQASTQASAQSPAQAVQPQSQPSEGQTSLNQQVQNLPPPVQQPQSQPIQGPPPVVPTAAPQLPPPPPPTTNQIPELPQHSQQIIAATEKFKESMLQSFKVPQGEEILNSAVNQVLGYTHESSLPGNKYEENIIKILRTMLEQIPGSNITPASTPSNTERVSTPQPNGSQQSPAATNQNETQGSGTSTPQASKTSGIEKPAPTVMRPTFTGQGQSRPSIPRPQMGTPTLKATPSPVLNGEVAQLAGQKRRLSDEADDFRDAKRLNGNAMSSVKT